MLWEGTVGPEDAGEFAASGKDSTRTRSAFMASLALAIGSSRERCRADRVAGNNQLNPPILLPSGRSIVRRDRLRLAEARGCHHRRRDALRDEVRAH